MRGLALDLSRGFINHAMPGSAAVDPNPFKTPVAVKYVSTSGADANTGNSELSPWSLGKAIAEIQGNRLGRGTHVIILPGAYAPTSGFDLTGAVPPGGADDFVYLRGKSPTERPVIKPVTAADYSYAFRLRDGTQRIAFGDLILDGVDAPGDVSLGDGVSDGIKMTSVTNIWVKGVLARNWNACGIVTYPASGEGADFVLIEDCEVTNCGAMSLLGASGILIRGNTQAPVGASKMFTIPYPDGTTKQYGVILRRNYAHRNKQKRAGTDTYVTEGHGVAVRDLDSWGFGRPVLVENLLSLRNGGAGLAVKYSSSVDVVSCTLGFNGQAQRHYTSGKLRYPAELTVQNVSAGVAVRGSIVVPDNTLGKVDETTGTLDEVNGKRYVVQHVSAAGTTYASILLDATSGALSDATGTNITSTGLHGLEVPSGRDYGSVRPEDGSPAVGNDVLGYVPNSDFEWKARQSPHIYGALNVAAAGTVSLHPSDATVTEPNTATFSGDVLGANAFQWEVATLSGAIENVASGTGYTTKTFTTTATDADLDNGKQYRLRAWNTSDPAGTTQYTRWALLTVLTAVAPAVWPETVDYGPTGFTATRTVNVPADTTLTDALANAQAGDDIVLAADTYSGAFEITASLSSRARLRAADGATAILKSTTTAALFIRNARNWIIGSTAGSLVIDGAGVANSTLGIGVKSGTKESTGTGGGACQDIHLHNLEIRNAGQALLRIAYDSVNITVSNSRIHTSGVKKPEYGEGVYIGSANTTGTLDYTNNVKLLALDITGLTCEAMDFKPNSHTILVDGCLIHDIALNSPTTTTKGGIAQRTSEAGVVIKNTRIWNITRAGGTNNEAVGIYASGPYTAENVLIWGCAEGAVRVDGYAIGTSAVGTHKHCTFWNNGTPATGSSTAKSINLTNSAKASLDAGLYPSGTLHTNVTTTKSGTVANTDFVGPLTGAAKTDYAGDGFVLAPGSAHRSTIVPSVAVDLRGITRPDPASRGALEVAGATALWGPLDFAPLAADGLTRSELESIAGLLQGWTSSADTYLSVANDSTRGHVHMQTLVPTTTVGANGSAVVDWRRGSRAVNVFTRRALWLGFWLWFDPNFDWGGNAEGGKLPGLAGGSAPTEGSGATDGFSARLMWGTGGRLGVYAYHQDRPVSTEGESLRAPSGQDFFASKGQWIKVQLFVKCNTNSTTYDGEVKAYFNGTLNISRTDLRWRLDDIQEVDMLLYSMHYGGTNTSTVNWAPDYTTYIRTDGFVIGESFDSTKG